MSSTSKLCIRVPCQKCENCLKKDCGKCKSCKDNKKSRASGSSGKTVPKSPGKSPSKAAKKTPLKICEERACLELQLPSSVMCSFCKGHQQGKLLMECTSCKKISHPKCVRSTIPGVIKSEENNYWVCPKCCREQCTTFCDNPCPYSGKHHEIMFEMLKTNNHNVNDDRSKLKLFKDCVEKYVKKGWNCDGQSVPDESPKLRYPIMHLTVMFGKTQALDWLLQQGFKPLHTCKDQQPDPGSPLHLAVTGLKDGVKNPKNGNNGLVKLFAQIVDLFLIHSPPSFTYKHPQSQDSFLHFLARRCLEKEEDLLKEYLLVTLQKLKEYHGKVKMVNIKEVLCAKNVEGNTFLHLVVQENSLHDVVKYLATNFDAEFKVMSATKNKADDTPREIAAEKRCIKICEALGAPAELIQIIAQGNATDEEDEKKFTPNIDKETEAKRKRSESENNETSPKRRRVGEAEEPASNSSTSTSTSKKQADIASSQSEKQIDNTKQTEQSSDSKRSSDSSSHSKKQTEQSSRSKRSSDSPCDSKKQTEQSSYSKRSSDSPSASKKQAEQSSDSKRSSDSASHSKKQTEQSSNSKISSDSASHSKKQTEQSSDSKRSSDNSSHSKKQTEQSRHSKRASDSSNHIKKEAEPLSQSKRSSQSSGQSKEQVNQSKLVREHPDISCQGKDTDDSGQSKRSNEQSLRGMNQTDNSNQRKKQVEQLSHGKKAESSNQSKKTLDESSESKKQFDNCSRKQVDNSSQDMKQADQSTYCKEDYESDDVSQLEVDGELGDIMDITDDAAPQSKEDTEDDCVVCKRSTPPTNEDVTGYGSAIQTTNTHTVFCSEECVARHSRVLQLLHRCNNSPHNSCNNIPSFMQVLDQYLHREGRSAAHRPIPDTVKEFRHPIVHWASVLGKYQLLNYLAKRKDFNLSVSNPLSDNETAIHRTLLFLEEALTRADPAVSLERIFIHFSKVTDVFAREAPVVFGKQNADGDTPFHLVAKAIMEVGQNRQLKCYDKFFKIMLQKVTDMAENSRPQFEKVKEMMCKTNSEGETFLHILTCRVGIGHELCSFTLEAMPEEILIRLKKIETRYGKLASGIAADLGSYKLAAHLSHEMSPRKMSTASDTPVQSPNASRAERAARRQDVRVAQWFEENQSYEESESQNDTVENQFIPVDEGELEVMSPVFSPQSKSSNKRKLSLDDLSDLTPRARTKKQVFSFSPSHDRSSPVSDSSGEVWSPDGIDSEEEETYAPAELGEIVAPEEYQEMDMPEEHEEIELEETKMPICEAESRELPAESNDPIHSTVVVDSGSEVAASSSVEVLKTEKGDDSSECNVSRRSAELKTESVQDAGDNGESQVTSTSPKVNAVLAKSSGLTTPTSCRSKGNNVDSKPIPKPSSADQSSDTTPESTPSQSSTKTLAKSARRNTSSNINQPTPSGARTKACIISGIMRSPHTPLVKQSIIKSLQSQFKSTLDNAKKSLKEEEEQLQSIRTKCVDAEEKKNNFLLQIRELDKTIGEAMDEEKKCQDSCKTKEEECKQFEVELEKCEASLQELAASI